MSVPQYNSITETNSGASGKKKNEPSQLAQDTFDAFEPFVNVFDCGVEVLDGPIHSIPKEAWALFRRHKAGERNLCFEDGEDFNPYLDIIRNIFSPKHVEQHFKYNEISYYTSGRKGYGLLYLDVDAHEPWQTDQLKAKDLLQTLFPFGYFRRSHRGQNGYLKVRYSSIPEFNEVADLLEESLKRLFLHAEIICDIEVKGTITHRGNSGKLAKLPFTAFGDDCWNYPNLKVFKKAPVVNGKRIRNIAQQAERQVDEERVAKCRKRKEREAERQQKRDKVISYFRRRGVRGSDERVWKKAKEVYEKWKEKEADPSRQSSPNGFASQNANRAVGDGPVRHTLRATPVAEKAVSASHREVSPPSESGHASGNAFLRNQQDLLPFVRSFYKRHRRFPTTEDALIHLRDNGLFSGEWQENQQRRATRIGQILAYTEQTFDPDLLGSEDTQPLSLSLGRFSWWVRQKFGAGMKAEIADPKRFDPVSMTAFSQRHFIPAKFIETFLVVADVCVNQDPLENMAVPTNRIKKIWDMVKGGAPWNQRYYQIVRDRLDRLGVISIFDRNHETGKAWRWDSGPNFPEDDWMEEKRKLKERCRRFGSPWAVTNFGMNNNKHNTLYQIDAPISGSSAGNHPIRPPPG